MQTKYKIYGLEQGETFYIDKMKLEDYLWYLNFRRHFNKELTIAHTKKYYNIDLTNILKDVHFFWEYKFNIYEDFYEQNPKAKTEDNTRQYFNLRGRRNYEKFIQTTFYSLSDCLSPYHSYKEIHHIHPLIYGGNNRIENLIHLSNFNHDLLHENPLEEHDKYCVQSVDYLGTLYSYDKLSEYIREFNFEKYSDEMMCDLYKACIKEDMRVFYKEKVNEFNDGIGQT